MRRSLLIPASLVLLAPLYLGCNSSDIPTTMPPAAQEPYDILAHLKYLAVRKDYKDAAMIAPITPDVVFPSAMHLHNDAKQLGITLTPDELKGLGIDAKLAAKLDNLPGGPADDYTIQDARLAFNAGIYRLLKALTPKTWAKMDSMGIEDNPGMRQYGSSAIVKDMTLGYGGTKIMTVTCLKKPDGYWGVSFIRYDVNPKTLKQN